MQRYYKSVKYTVIGGYVILTALLLASLLLIVDKMSQISVSNDIETELHEKRMRTNNAFSCLYRVESMGQTLDLSKTSNYIAYMKAVGEALTAVDSLKENGTDSIQILRTDSIHLLLLKKVDNLRLFIRAEASVNTRKDAQINALLAHQDTLLSVYEKQYQLRNKSDSLIAKEQSKGFFGKLARAFSSGKYKQQYDSLQQANADMSIYSDSLVSRLHNIEASYAKDREQTQNLLAAQRLTLEKNNRLLSLQINRLIHEYESELTSVVEHRQQQNEEIRNEALQTVTWIALIAIFIAMVFGGGIWYTLNRNNRYKTELEEANERATQLLVAREKMMLTITHDFKAPLSSIIGYISLLKRLIQGDRQSLYLENMRLSSEHLLNLVNNLLDFHKLDSDKITISHIPFNPYTLFDKEITAYEPIAHEKGLKLLGIWTSDKDNILYSGDPLRIKQIADNLLSNALKFTTNGSITVRLAVTNNELCFSVADTGCGIDEKNLSLIYNEFTRLPEAQGKEGFGLGLSITQKLVSLLDGSIEVNSTPNEGSTFTVRLPIEPCAQKEPPQENGKSFSGIKVLLLDDDDIQLVLFEEQLSQLGIVTTSCKHVTDALSYLQHETYDIFFTDLQMPEADGFEILHRLQNSPCEKLRRLPVVAVSARNDIDPETMRQKGFADTLEKPFSQKALYTVLSNLTGHNPEITASGQASDIDTSGYRFDLLTAFAENDSKARIKILSTCMTEMQSQISAIIQARQNNNDIIISSIAHKWIPLFTMLDIQSQLPTLRKIEKQENISFAETEQIINEARQIVSALESALSKEENNEQFKNDTDS